MKEIMECRLVPAEGTPFEISLNVGGEYDRSDRLVRYRVVLVDVSRLKLMERQARETGDKLRLLASELNLSEERTRKAIAQTLHDEVGQMLAMARMKISSRVTLPKDDGRGEDRRRGQLDMLSLDHQGDAFPHGGYQPARSARSRACSRHRLDGREDVFENKAWPSRR